MIYLEEADEPTRDSFIDSILKKCESIDREASLAILETLKIGHGDSELFDRVSDFINQYGNDIENIPCDALMESLRDLMVMTFELMIYDSESGGRE